MKYNSGYPFFFKKDVNYILKEFRNILMGKGTLRMGKFVEKFEKNFAKSVGTKKAISTTSCTAALETILNSLNLKNNEEVIIPCQTYVASASTILRAGGKPIIAEIDKEFNLDFNDMKKKITKKTKGVVIVHFGGKISKNIFLIKRYLKKKKIILIEDAAHGLGASFRNKYAGSIGDIAAFSFYSTKIITTGEGGMISTNNLSLATKCEKFRSRGMKLNSNVEIYDSLGTNFRMTEVQALLGLTQLANLKKFIKYRNTIASIYNKNLNHLAGTNIITLPSFDKIHTNAFWRYIVVLRKDINRKKVLLDLKKYSIDVIHSYDPLIHKQPLIKNLYGKSKKMIFSESYCKQHIMLPIHYNIKKNDAIFISKILINSINSKL